MWREQAGFLEMFLAYYGQFEENLLRKKTYTEFLFDIICAHESLTYVVPRKESSSFQNSFTDFASPLHRSPGTDKQEAASALSFSSPDASQHSSQLPSANFSLPTGFDDAGERTDHPYASCLRSQINDLTAFWQKRYCNV